MALEPPHARRGDQPPSQRRNWAEVPPTPPWTYRPPGTVPWGGRSGGGWDNFFAGTGGPSRGRRSPSVGEIIQAMIDAYREGRAGR